MDIGQWMGDVKGWDGHKKTHDRDSLLEVRARAEVVARGEVEHVRLHILSDCTGPRGCTSEKKERGEGICQ